MLVASLGREMGMQGVAKGDVVTHFDGKKFDRTAGDLAKLIKVMQDGRMHTFVFNANDAVAKALKQRSLVLGFE